MLKPLLTAAGAASLIASAALAAPSANAASYTKCERDAPVLTCVTTTGGRSVGWQRMGSYLLPKSNVTTKSECFVTKSATTKWSFSVEVSAEWKAWIFAKVSATVSGGLEKSTTISAGVKRSFTQKKGETYRCEWGYSKYQSSVTMRVTAAGQSYERKGTFTGPKEMELRVTKL
ncbi:MAG: hypothetical protein QM619_11835 [Micropruina sp.]|uniref:hypothetical protein n=1 Tax=Micropruina sp. TaxID=2737536 RepID=UPI0039E34773